VNVKKEVTHCIVAEMIEQTFTSTSELDKQRKTQHFNIYSKTLELPKK
ncbi:hypothetical protein HEP_00369800, partial [Hepatocystis sp. ex Piliocolobus tephrosceles]